MLLAKLIAAVVDAPARSRREARVRALVDEGASLVRAGDACEAAKCYARALELEPTAGAAHTQLALLYTGLQRAGEALPHFRAAHAAGALPDDALQTFVRVLLAHGGHDEALRVAQQAALAQPSAARWFCLGLAYAADNRYADALACYDRAAALESDAELHTHRGIALQYLGRLRDAHAEYERALALAPGHPVAAFHRSLGLLARGRYTEGWPGYELRLASAEVSSRPRRYPRWDGSDPAGRTLLVHGEQGLGDEIMFASCIRDLIWDGARCVIECDPRLRALFARSFPESVVYGAAADRRVPDAIDALSIDAEVPIGSLPLYYRPARDAFADHRGYLRADPQRVAAWRARLAALGADLTVGISWAGGTHASRAPLRSIPLAEWLPILATPGVRFVSLQYGEAAAELSGLLATHDIRVVHWPDAIADYDETAALVSALDVTISVCTSVVHLAGALGRPVWVMAPVAAEWRYGACGEGMAWYPSARVYRQRAESGWGEVLAQVGAALRSFAEGCPAAEAPLNAAQRLNGEGTSHLASREFATAQVCFERALALAPALHEARVNLAISLLEQGRAAEGEWHLREAIARNPHFVPAQENLALLLSSRFDHEAALEVWNAVLALAPQHPQAHAAKAFIALREGRLDEARTLQRRALECGADGVAIAMQEASMLALEGDATGARRLLESLRGSAQDADLDWELATCALAGGEFAEGWRLYESRLVRAAESPRRPYRFPQWDGTPLKDGALLVLAEQGIGDEIMFASCYPDAIARADECVIECEPRLARLFARSFPQARVIAQGRGGANAELLASTRISRQIHAGSLPRLFRTRVQDFPRHDGYLAADPHAVEAWRRRLGAANGKRLVGLAWSGGLRHTRRALRSVPTATFGRVMRVADVDFVSLQHDDTGGAVAAELASLAGQPVHVFEDVFSDFDDMAALVRAVDCVVTVCSSVVHLAGALGVPALVLTPAHPEWRYMREGSSLPWYPSVRLLRQPRGAGWEDVVEDARAALSRLFDNP